MQTKGGTGQLTEPTRPDLTGPVDQRPTQNWPRPTIPNQHNPNPARITPLNRRGEPERVSSQVDPSGFIFIFYFLKNKILKYNSKMI